jgi:uncharacterized protein
MKLGSTFTVPTEQSRVFAHFLAPDSMRASIPGCTELERTDTEHYRGKLVNEIAHVRFSAGFSAEITELTEPAEVRAVLKGEDRRLGSSIKIDATLKVAPAAGDPATSQVEYALDIALWGKIGRLGESIVRRRSTEVEKQFVAIFSEICAGGPPGAEHNPTLAKLLAAETADGKVSTLAADDPKPTTAVVPADGKPAKVSFWQKLLNLFRKKQNA